LHLDHAGGLEYFRGTDVPIYTHELELKNAFYSVATKTDIGKSASPDNVKLIITDDIMPGVYMPTYLQFDLNWKPFHGDGFELAKGLIVRHCPGHTPGLSILQTNLKDSGTWIFTTDQYIVRENYESLANPGWFTRDHASWSRSNQMVQSLQKLTDAKLIFGHDREVLFHYKTAPEFYT
jgi:glyoxylase-like metal-dependent hydrolase (beta-lactamase superfamily II)